MRPTTLPPHGSLCASEIWSTVHLMTEAFVVFFVVVSYALGYLRGRNTGEGSYQDMERDFTLLKKLSDDEHMRHMVQVDGLRAEIQRLEAMNRGQH